MSAAEFHTAISEKYLSSSTKTGYSRKQEHFKSWLQENHADICTDINGAFTLKNVPKTLLHIFISERSVWSIKRLDQEDHALNPANDVLNHVLDIFLIIVWVLI